MAFNLEKDVMLLSVACMTQVHVFEYQEDKYPCLNHMAIVDKA